MDRACRAAALLAALLALAPAPCRAGPQEACLWRSVRFSPVLSGGEVRALKRALGRIWRTPLGQERAARLCRAPWRVDISTGNFDLRFSTADGAGEIDGQVANTDVTADPMQVTFSTAVLTPEAQPWLIDSAAHELLGHVAAVVEARRAGAEAVWRRSADDEMGASLVGAVVGLEAGTSRRDDAAASLLVSTQAFVERMWLGQIGHPANFSPEETLAPAAALQRRLEFLSDKLRVNEREMDAVQTWIRYEVHFVLVHEVPEQRFARLWDDVMEWQDRYPRERAALEKTRQDVQGSLTWLGLKEGLDLRQALAEPKSQEYLASFRAENLALLERLRRLHQPRPRPGRSSPPASAEAEDQIGWDQLREMVKEDEAAHPEHWR